MSVQILCLKLQQNVCEETQVSEPYPPLLTQFTRDLSQEPRRPLDPLIDIAVWPNRWVQKIELVLRPGDRDIEKPAFFFDVFIRLQRAGAGKHAVGQPHDKYRLPLETLGLVNRRKGHSLSILVLGAKLFGFASGHQRKLAKKFDWLLEAAGKTLQGRKIFAALFMVGIL